MKSALARVKRGFKKRELALRMLARPPALPIIKRAGPAMKQLDLRIFSRQLLSTRTSYNDYIKTISPLLPDQYRDIIMAYYFSAEAIEDRDSLLSFVGLSDSQYSILVQSVFFANGVTNTAMSKEIEKGISCLSDALHSKGEVTTVEDLVANLVGEVNERFKSIQDIRSSIYAAKEIAVHTLGPDIFTAIQKILDPDWRLDDRQLKACNTISQLWRIDRVVDGMLHFRSFRNLPYDKEAETSAEIIRNSRPGRGYFSVSTALMQRLMRRILSINDPRSIVTAIACLYNFDAETLCWVDWDTVYHTLGQLERIEGFDVALLHILFAKSKPEHFPLARMRIGDGAFESSLRSAVHRLPTKDIQSIVSEVRKLPGSSKTLMAHTLIRGDTAAILSSLLSYDPPWARKLVQAQTLSYDARPAAFSLDAAKALLEVN